ncbi:hypothetical protein OE88DRAFT_1660478 [Heliocybe sulcata]|uniref:Uncharacterized protein n=1 Tax=Heliocybe sulcata TaxID=5364 RepID=A0A5C3N076_9AGAM|nr:hypothetical protein OE88DRAFT_1660478 [Heliocybe sulcata]
MAPKPQTTKTNDAAKGAAPSSSSTIADGWTAIQQAINEQTRRDAEEIAKIEKAVPTFTGEGTVKELQVVDQIIKTQAEEQKVRLGEVTRMVKEDFPKQAVSKMQAEIQVKIREEIARQVEREVNDQIGSFLKPTLKDQIHDSQAHLRKLKDTIKNTDALRMNSMIEQDDFLLPLEPLLKEDGAKSMWWPENLEALCGYDKNRMSLLLTDYGLPVQGSWKANLDRFLSHIGVKSYLMVVEPDSDDSRSFDGDQKAATAAVDGAGSDPALAGADRTGDASTVRVNL